MENFQLLLLLYHLRNTSAVVRVFDQIASSFDTLYAREHLFIGLWRRWSKWRMNLEGLGVKRWENVEMHWRISEKISIRAISDDSEDDILQSRNESSQLPQGDNSPLLKRSLAEFLGQRIVFTRFPAGCFLATCFDSRWSGICGRSVHLVFLLDGELIQKIRSQRKSLLSTARSLANLVLLNLLDEWPWHWIASTVNADWRIRMFVRVLW